MVAINNLYESRIRLTQQQSLLRTGNVNENNISIFSNTEGLTQGMIDGTCIDGKDDGKIGIGEGIKSIAKGAVKSVTNMFSSPENIVKTVATGVAGAALIAVTGGAATPFLIAGGAIAGGIQTGKGIYEATQAETDAEKRAALENVGGGAATLAMSAAAGKAYTNATGNALIGKGSLSTYKNALEASKTNVSANFGKFTSAFKGTTTEATTTELVNSNVNTNNTQNPFANSKTESTATYTQEQLHKVYKKASVKCHPDNGGNNDLMATLNSLYEMAQNGDQSSFVKFVSQYKIAM